MTIPFHKYEGAGNDFILVDSRKIGSEWATLPVVKRFCDRHFGIGADGLILLLPSESQDFHMKYYNSDGNEGTMCGNGGRCLGAFAHRLGLIGESGTFSATDGLHTVTIHRPGHVELTLNEVSGVKVLDDGYLLDTGSPHFITFTGELDEIDVFGTGRKIRHEPRFREGVNINFTERFPGGIRVRTYERGVENETLSCGTGVTAAAIAATLEDPDLESPVKVQTRGGNLEVSFTPVNHETFTDIRLTGPATRAFEGTIAI